MAILYIVCMYVCFVETCLIVSFPVMIDGVFAGSAIQLFQLFTFPVVYDH